MFREDYLIRAIQQMTAVVGEILGLTRLQKYPQALAEVDRALQSYAGLNLSLVTPLSAAELVDLTRFGEQLDVAKLLVLADLLQVEGDIYAAQGQPGEAAERHLKALELNLEVAFASEHNLLPAAPRVDALAERLAAVELPEALGEWLTHYQSVSQATEGADE
jgi:tetratricopeptide (TPR) repeat protein